MLLNMLIYLGHVAVPSLPVIYTDFAAKCYDYFDDCQELTGKDPDYCNKKQAFHGCHKTCNFCGENQEKTGMNSGPSNCLHFVVHFFTFFSGKV